MWRFPRRRRSSPRAPPLPSLPRSRSPPLPPPPRSRSRARSSINHHASIDPPEGRSRAVRLAQYTRRDSTPSASQSLPPAAAPIPHLTGDELLLQRREEAGDRQWRRGPHHPHARRHQPRARRLPRPRGQRQRLRRAPGVLHRRREEGSKQHHRPP
ncbi:hypothetical protein PVAP13_9KG590400 [Panicum virgatum]|uniref:Uncharacterized protein n=1 Tax=Panicum virgatum TaxID=38727 RepID=A0A8T0NZ78_PANVG|nr:hypothetical protein PVAP13_9KG590400 [Panicum virgatum]